VRAVVFLRRAVGFFFGRPSDEIRRASVCVTIVRRTAEEKSYINLERHGALFSSARAAWPCRLWPSTGRTSVGRQHDLINRSVTSSPVVLAWSRARAVAEPSPRPRAVRTPLGARFLPLVFSDNATSNRIASSRRRYGRRPERDAHGLQSQPHCQQRR